MAEFYQIISDGDGVLVDGERIANIVFAEMLNAEGLPGVLASGSRV